jgi:hypothetical protein
MMTFSLCHTSARPAEWRAARDLWLSRAAHRGRVEHLICLDVGSPLGEGPVEPSRLVWNDFRHDCVTGWNAAAGRSTGDVLIAMADDFEPPEGWDDELEAVIGDPSREVVVDVATGVRMTDNAELLALSIETRARYRRLGYLFYPMYRSMFCDDDFTEHAVADGVVVKARHLLFQHHHPVSGEVAWDEVYLKQNSPDRYAGGQSILLHRRQTGFSDEGRVAVQVLCCEAFMLEDSVKAVAEDAEAVFLQVPTEMWNGTEVPDEQVDLISRVANGLWISGVRCCVQRLDVRAERLPGRDRYQVEAGVRNQGLRMIRRAGMGTVLVVDSDELWMPECSSRVFNAYYAGATALTVQMVPVIGCPAYPVDGATDAALVLLAGGREYTACRSTSNPQALKERLILHFTGTRESREAVARKMRESGHYGDPDYDFEGWITNTLPNIKPGMVNAHMFRPWQIWPRVRAFSARERKHIPARLHKYLGNGQ